MDGACKEQDINRNDGKFKPGQSGNPAGREKGSKNRYTKLRNAILDAVELAADKYEKGMKSDDYLATICKADPLTFLRIAASVLPKEIKQENTDRVTITMGPDEDCK